MSKLNITPGEWDVNGVKGLLHIETSIDNPIGAGIHICSVPKASKDLAILIADTGTTYNKCGLLPSELLGLRDELLYELKNAKYILENERKPNGIPLDKAYLQSYAAICQAIQNAENKL